MPTVTLNAASGTPYHDAFTRVGGSNKWDIMHDASDATYVKSLGDGGSQQQSMFLDTLPPGVAEIGAVTGTTRLKVVGGSATCNALLYLSSGSFDLFRATSSTSLTTFTDDPVARPGGGDWAVEDFESGVAQVGNNNGGNQTDVAWMVEASIDVTYAAGGFAMLVALVAQWLPPLSAAASHGLINREIVKILSGLKTRPSSEQDFAAIRAALRTRPVYVFQD